MKKAYTGPVYPFTPRVTWYPNSNSVVDCQGAEIYIEQLMYRYPYREDLDKLHSLIRQQNGVNDGVCVELARKAENMILKQAQTNPTTLREVLEQVIDPSYTVEDQTGLDWNAEDLLTELSEEELSATVYWDGLPKPALNRDGDYPEVSKIWLVNSAGHVLEPDLFEIYLEIDRIDPFNSGSNFKTHKGNFNTMGRRRVATEIKGIHWFSGEKPLIKELERWGDPEEVKTGKVYWHRRRQQYLLVPGNPSKAEVAGGLAKKDKYGDDVPKDKAKQKKELEFISVSELKKWAKQYGVKDWYVDNVYGKRVYRKEYDKKETTALTKSEKGKIMISRKKDRKGNFRRRRRRLAGRGDAFLRYTDEFGSEVQLEIDDELIGVFNNQDEAIEFIKEWANENHYYPTLYFKDIDATLEEIDYRYASTASQMINWKRDPHVARIIERGAELGHEVDTIVKAVVEHLGDTTLHYNKKESDAIWSVVKDYVSEYDAEREAYAKRIARKRHRKADSFSDYSEFDVPLSCLYDFYDRRLSNIEEDMWVLIYKDNSGWHAENESGDEFNDLAPKNDTEANRLAFYCSNMNLVSATFSQSHHRHRTSCCGRGRPHRTGRKWESLPEGWDKDSLESYWNSMGGSVSSCVEELQGDPEITDPGAFCASLADRVEGKKWRHRPRKHRRK